jgi:general secretion pathway protein K
MSRAPRSQRGVALLVALLVVALAVILVAALLDRGELAFARTRNGLRAEQAAAYAQGLELYAAQVLLDAQGVNAGIDSNASPWTLPLPPQPVPGGTISATMRDLNGCFNLNNLMPPPLGPPNRNDWLRVFGQLRGVRGVDPALAGAVADWLDPDGNAAGEGIYLSQPVPYRPARRAFAHVSELRLVSGVSGEVYAQLAPYVCALPPGTRINVDTASVPVLQALLDTTPAVAERLWQNGSAQWTTDAFKAQLGPLGIVPGPALDGEIASASTYFLARGDIVLDDVPFTFHSLIERGQGSGIRVLERSRGSDAASAADALAALDTSRDGLAE